MEPKKTWDSQIFTKSKYHSAIGIWEYPEVPIFFRFNITKIRSVQKKQKKNTSVFFRFGDIEPEKY